MHAFIACTPRARARVALRPHLVSPTLDKGATLDYTCSGNFGVVIADQAADSVGDSAGVEGVASPFVYVDVAVGDVA